MVMSALWEMEGILMNGRAEMPTGHNNPKQQMYALARAHHETVNRCFKCFGCLSNIYMHPLHQHGTMEPLSHVIVNITQVAIMDNEPLNRKISMIFP